MDNSQNALTEPTANPALLQATLDSSLNLIQLFTAVRDEAGAIVDFTWVFTNRAAQRVYGDVIGQRLLTRAPDAVPAGSFDTFKQVVETGEPDQSEHHVAHATLNGWFLQSVVKLGDGVVTTMEEITARKQRAANLAFIADLMNDLSLLTTAEEIMEMAGKRLTEHLELSRYMFVEIFPEAGSCTYLLPSRPDGQLEISGSFTLADYHTAEEHRLLCAGHSMIVNDVRDGTRTPEQITAFAAFDIASIVNTPYISKGRWVFDLGVARSAPSVWREDEIELLREFSARLWLRIERARAEAALRASEEKYRTLFEMMDEGYFLCDVLFDENGNAVDIFYLDANPSAQRMVGQNFTGRRLRKIDPNYEAYWYEIFGRVALTGEPARQERYAAPDALWYNFYVFKVGGLEDHHIAVLFEDITERKRRELNAALLDEIGKDLSVLSTPDEVIEAVGTRLGEFLDASSCIFADVDEAKNEATIHHGWNTAHVPSLKQTFRLADYFGEEFARAGRAGETVIVRDTGHDERANAEAYARLQLGAFVTVPFQRHGRWTANITVTSREPRDWRADEIELLQEIAARVFPRIERARAEAALRERETELARVQRIGGVAGVAIDVQQGLIGHRSPEYLHLHGLSPEQQEETHADWLRRLHPADRERADNALRQALAGTATSYRADYRIIRVDDGQERWVSAVMDIERDVEGRPVRLIGAHIDITKRARAEAALRASEARMRIALDAAQMATWEWHLRTDEIYWNEQHFLLFGMTPRTTPMQPDDFFAHVHPDERGWLAERLQAAVAGRSVFAAEFRCVTEAGEQRWMSGYGRVTADVGGLATHMSGVMFDITERKQVEASLRESEERFRAVANLVPDLLWSSEPDGSTNWYNQRWLEYTGQTLEQACGWGWTDAIHPDDRAAAARRYHEAVAAGKPLRQEHRIRSYDGVYRWFVVQVQPVQDEAGNILRWFGAATDIHEQRRTRDTLERHVQERTHELAALSATRQHLLDRLITAQEDERRRIAHDLHDSLGQHLVALDIGLKTVEALDGFPPEVELRIGALRAMARHLDTEVERLTVALRPPALDDLGLPDALRRHIHQWRADSPIGIDLHISGFTAQRLPAVVETAVFRIAQEALTNIRKHAQATHVSLLLEQRPGEVQVIIEDNGEGFDMATVQAVAGERVHFGLNSMRERATLIGGQLEVESTPGVGTTLYLHVPLGDG